MKLFKGRVELVTRPRRCVWKATTSYAPGLRPGAGATAGRDGSWLSVSVCGVRPNAGCWAPWKGRGREPQAQGLATPPASMNCISNCLCLAAATFPI